MKIIVVDWFFIGWIWNINLRWLIEYKFIIAKRDSLTVVHCMTVDSFELGNLVRVNLNQKANLNFLQIKSIIFTFAGNLALYIQVKK